MTTRLVTVARYATPELAHLAKNRLEADGITSYLADETLVGMDWQLGNTAVGAIKLQVAAADEAEACLILDVEDEPDSTAEPRRESVNPIRWAWWKATWGRPSMIVVIATWIWGSTVTLTFLPLCLADLYRGGGQLDTVGGRLSFAASLLLFGGIVGLHIAAIVRTTYYYLRLKERAS